jgi:Ni/Co efflux regulator RcnB
MNKLLLGAALLSLSLAGTGIALADPPPGKGQGKGQSASQSHDRDPHVVRRGREGADVDIVVNFPSRDIGVVRDYFAGRDFCPPGLAKKNNGCLPPGQAKKWRMGQPLPRDVVFYDLPRDLLGRLAPAPQGYRYVRVDNDILKIVTGSGLIVDVIANLGRS